MASRQTTILVLLAIAALLSLCVAPFFGMTSLPPFALISGGLEPVEMEIFWRIRLPRVLFAFLAGSSLAVGGMVFQALFCNFLASPFTLGVASGAAFGTALYYNLGISFALAGLGGETFFSMAGALITIVPVFFMTRSQRGMSSIEILLAGVVISLFFSSLIVFIQYISDFTGILRITRWLMGGFEVVGFSAVAGILFFFLIGTLPVWLCAFELNLFTIGEELAQSRGLDVKRKKALLLLATSLMVGGVVSWCGPISSVGIMAPHICRLLLGLDHRVLVPATVLCGGTFVVICDTFARTVIAPYEIPVGVITALLEGPFFLWLLYRRKWRS